MEIKNGGSIFLMVLFFLFLGCVTSQNNENDTAYKAQIQQWRKSRLSQLTRPDGWVSLAGLFWLKEGENSFGADSSNDIIFPPGKAAPAIGSFFLKNGEVSVKIHKGIKVLSGGKPVTSLRLQNDMDGDPTLLNAGSLRWYIIKRGDKFGVRLKDSENPPLKHFLGLENYPIDIKWRIKARFEPFRTPKQIPVPSIIGITTEEESPGRLIFRIEGKTYSLDPILEKGEERYFVVFADRTNGKETYGAGRFVYVDPPGPDGTTYIDFNQAYNPPCVFTDFATCPLPPPQNRLPIAVTAGEKKYAGANH